MNAKIFISFFFRSLFLFLALSASGVLYGCAGYKGDRKTFYGIKMGVPPLAFIIDISGSMGSGVGDTARSNIALMTINHAERNIGSVRTGIGAVDSLLGGVRSDMFNAARSQTTKLAEARRQLVPFLRGLPNGARFSVTAFNDRYQRFGAGGIPATPQTRARAVGFVNAFDAQGGTNMSSPIEEVLRERPATVYLVSDGKPSESDAIILAIAQRARLNGTVIHTIGVGEDQNQILLQQIARITGGIYRPQGTTISLTSAFLSR